MRGSYVLENLGELDPLQEISKNNEPLVSCSAFSL